MMILDIFLLLEVRKYLTISILDMFCHMNLIQYKDNE